MMNFNLPNAILTSRVQQQQQSHPNSQIPASSMSNQSSFPSTDDSTKQSPIGINPQAHVPQNNNNNNNSHGASLPSAQQLLMQQNRNSNVTNHPQINKSMTQMTSTNSQQQHQTTFHQQQIMTSITKSQNMNILQQMNQFVYQQNITPGPITNVQQSHNIQHAAMGNSGTQKFHPSHQQPQMQMRQNYGASPPHVVNSSTSNQSQQNMQYSPSKPIHPQMKTTAKLASPGSQLQNLQKSPPQGTSQTVPTVPSLQQQQQHPSNVSQQAVTQTQINPIPISQPSSASSNVVSPQKTTKTILSPVKNVTVQPTPPPALSNIPVSIPIQSNPASSSVPSSITVNSSLSISTSAPIQTLSSQVILAESNAPNQDVSAKQQPKVFENNPTVSQQSANNTTNNNDAGQKISPVTPNEEVKKPIVSPPPAPIVKTSTMRLATVTTPPRKKPPPTITKKVTPLSAQKKSASNVPVKSEGEKPKKSLPENPKPSTSLSATKKSENLKSSVATESSVGPSNITPKTKRIRTKVQPYQIPTPEIALVTKLSTQIANGTNKNGDDKLTLFYKNEFLAVRNGEGGFYLCQAMHNVYRSSPKIKIRWLNEKFEGKLSTTGGRVFSFDFYDLTDLECVLTTVELEKVEPKTYELPKEEIARIESILKKAIDVEKGILPRPSVTENNPDGLDLSIYKDESQLDKLSSRKRKGKKSDEEDDDDDEDDEPLSKKKKATELPAKKNLAPRASTRKPVVDAESSESDEENLLEIKNKAKSQAETIKAEKEAPKSVEKKIEAKPIVAARGRKRVAEKVEDTPPEKTQKVLKTERVEEKKQASPQKASPKAAKNVKAAAQSPAVKESVKTNVKDKKQSAKDKPSDSTTVVKKETVSKVQTSPQATGKNKVTKMTKSPQSLVKKSQVKEENASPRGRNTRSKK